MSTVTGLYSKPYGNVDDWRTNPRILPVAGMCLYGPSFVEMMMQRNRVASPTRFSPLLLQTLFKKPLLPQTKMQDEPEDLSLPESERRFRADFWNFIERKKRTGEIVLACSACLIVFSDPLLYRMHVSTHALGRSFQCVACGTVCSDRVAFQQHLVISRHG